MRFAAVFLLSWVLSLPAQTTAAFEQLSAQAAAARAAENAAEAIKFYRQALQLKPDWEEGWWFLGVLYYDSDQYAAGREAFTRLVAVNEKSAAGWAFLGLCEFETGAYDASLSHIEKGLALAGGVPPEAEQVLRFHEALLLTRDHRWDQARRVYRLLVERGIQNPTLILGIGVNALEQPILPSQIAPSQADLVSMAGEAAFWWMKGDGERTESAFRALLERYPSAPGVHYLYATHLLAAEHRDEGTAELRRELDVNPSSPSANGMMGMLLVLNGKPADALPYAKKALETAVPDPRAIYVYGIALAATGDTRAALERLETSERLDPGNLECHIALAGVYSRLGRAEDARRERRLSIAMARNNVQPPAVTDPRK